MHPPFRTRALAAAAGLALALAAPAERAAADPAQPGTQTAAAPATLSPEDRQTVERIERFLTGIDTLHGRFVQTSSEGGRATGELWLDRPGKLRFEYDPPSPILIVSNGDLVLYFDRELEQTSYVPVSETPLAFLVKPEVDLQNAEDYRVARLERTDGRIALWVVQEGVQPGQPGSLRLVLEAEPLRLARWRVVDQQGAVTRVSLHDVETGITVDPDLFEFGEIEGRPMFNRNRNR
jgi:outer membrane lipoprotein-sorting protein